MAKKDVEAKFKQKIYAYALKNAVEHEKAKPNKVLNSLFEEGLEKKDIEKVMPLIKEQVKEVNKLSKDEKEVRFEDFKHLIKEREEREGLKDLPNVKKRVVMRLAPFPSGALHIGNVKTYLLNSLYCEKYSGKLRLVIDDTIGSKEKEIVEEAYKLIPEAFKWLNVKYKKPVIYKSDRLKIYYKYAKKLIAKKKAYVCSCSKEDLRKNRKEGIECGCRQYPVEEHKKRWKKMFSKKTKPGDFTLRIKTNMKHKNPAFRDRVLFRISDKKHPRTGKKHKVWPLLEFSWAIDDHLLNITHILRGKDLQIESKMEKYIWDIFGWKKPEIIHTGLARVKDVKISKSKAQKEVRSGKFTGWDDPRTWSVQSLKRRGFKPESIKEFVKKMGLNEKNIEIPVDKLYAENRKRIDKKADRYSFLEKPVKLKIKKKPKIKEVKVKVHPEKKKKRKRKVGDIYISRKDLEENKNKEVRLMHLFNVRLNKIVKFTGKENKEIPKLNWVSKFVNARILMPDGNWINGIAEEQVKNLKNKVIQFERFGFVKFDKKNEAGEYEFWFTHS